MSSALDRLKKRKKGSPKPEPQAKPQRQPKQTADQPAERQAPRDEAAERAVVGGAILAPELLDQVVDEVSPRDFFDSSLGTLFGHLLAMHNENVRIDSTLLVDRLKRHGDLEQIGGLAEIAKIVNATPTAANTIYYARIVRENALGRELIVACHDAVNDAYDRQRNCTQILDELESRIHSISDARGSASNTATIQEAANQALEAMLRRFDGDIGDRVPIGLNALDDIVCGFSEGALVVVAARPGVGKSALAMNIADRIVESQGRGVFYASVEMPKSEFGERLLCTRARVDSHKLRKGFVSKDERRRLIEASSELASLPFVIDDSEETTIPQIAARARRMARSKEGLALVIVDYLQLVKPVADRTITSRQEAVAQISRSLKVMARGLRVPVLCMAQLNRQGADGYPQLHNLRESGAIEQDADVVLLLDRPWQRNEKQATIDGRSQEITEAHTWASVAKNRGGPTGVAWIRYEKQYFSFTDLATSFDDDPGPDYRRNLGDTPDTGKPWTPASYDAGQRAAGEKDDLDDDAQGNLGF